MEQPLSPPTKFLRIYLCFSCLVGKNRMTGGMLLPKILTGILKDRSS